MSSFCHYNFATFLKKCFCSVQSRIRNLDWCKIWRYLKWNLKFVTKKKNWKNLKSSFSRIKEFSYIVVIFFLLSFNIQLRDFALIPFNKKKKLFSQFFLRFFFFDFLIKKNFFFSVEKQTKRTFLKILQDKTHLDNSEPW